MKILSCIVLSFFSCVAFCDELPFSEAVRVGNILYLSGQIGTIELGNPTLIAGGISPETQQTMKNIKDVLKKNNSSMDKIIKCTIMLADIHDWPAMNKEYVSFFQKGHFPARSAFATTGLAFNARVEIECIATVIANRP